VRQASAIPLGPPTSSADATATRRLDRDTMLTC